MMWVALISAFIALCAGCLALISQKDFRARYLPPRLEMVLADDTGTSALALPQEEGMKVANSGERRPPNARYYHLRVSNPRRRTDLVNGVAVTLLSVRREGDATAWTGDLPLKWRNEDQTTRTVGTWADADLCRLLKGEGLRLLVRSPAWDLKVLYRTDEAPVDLVVTVQARGHEVDSEKQRWRIRWDGHWSADDAVMSTHLSVTPVT